MDISINILNWLLTLFNNLNPLTKRQEKKNLFTFQKEWCAPGTQTSIADLDNRICRGMDMSFCADKLYLNTFYLDNTRLQWE